MSLNVSVAFLVAGLIAVVSEASFKVCRVVISVVRMLCTSLNAHGWLELRDDPTHSVLGFLGAPQSWAMHET
jgi:hypothetical protein